MSEPENLKRFFETRWGIRFTEDHAKDLQVLLTKNKVEPGADQRQMLERLVNGETYFFRYPIYLEILRELLKDRVQKSFQKRFRILCAGCSTGEEPYSIAFSLSELAKTLQCKLEIVACDLRNKAIEIAKAAIYSRWSLRNMNAIQTRQFLVSAGDGMWQVADVYREMVDFRVHNLMEPLEEKPFDAILLCNVLMYMHDPAIAKAYDRLESCITEDSVLITGPADPGPSDGWYLQREYGGWPVFFRKPSAPTNYVVEEELPSLQPAAKMPTLSRPHTVKEKKPSFEFTPPKPPATNVPVSEEQLWHAWAQGKLEAAADQIRQKVFFEPEHPLWRFLNGVILMEHGWLQKSAKEMEKANLLLNSYKPEDSISGLCSADELRRMIEFWRHQNG